MCFSNIKKSVFGKITAVAASLVLLLSPITAQAAEITPDMDPTKVEYEYQCYSAAGATANSWQLFTYYDGEYLGSEELVDFSVDSIPENADVLIYSTYGDEPITISQNLRTLFVNAGNVVVNGNVESASVYWVYDDPGKNIYDVDLQINGDVASLALNGSCKKVNVVVTGAITTGYLSMAVPGGVQKLAFSKDASVSKVMTEGALQIMAETVPADGSAGLGVILPGARAIEEVEEMTKTVLYDRYGNVVATHNAAVTATLLESVSAQEEALFKKDRRVDVAAYVDVDVLSYYLDTMGAVYVDEAYMAKELTELKGDIMITLQIPEAQLSDEKVFSVLREHNGIITELQDLDANADTVTFISDRFSTYAIVSPKLTAAYAVGGSVTSFAGEEAVTIELTAEGATEASYSTVSTDGTYAILEVEEGNYIMTVAAADHVTRAYTIAVTEGDVVQDVEIWRMGDINGDGQISIMDYVKVLATAKNRDAGVLVGYAYQCANINGDNTISIADYVRILAHAKGNTFLW